MESVELSFDDNLKKQLLEQDRVIVRIWTSGVNQNDSGESVGHVSIEIPGEKIYWSLWPKQATDSTLSAKDTEGRGLIKGISTEPIESFTYQKDLNYEGRDPELVFYFYTLKIHKIKNAFEGLCQSKIKWNFLGRIFFSNVGSCASSAWGLLKAGDINSLVSVVEQSSVSSKNSFFGSYLSSMWSVKGSRQQLASNKQLAQDASNQSTQAALYTTEMVVSPLIDSPDYIGELLKKAKANELGKEPITQHIHFEGETNVAPSQVSSWMWCNIT